MHIEIMMHQPSSFSFILLLALSSIFLILLIIAILSGFLFAIFIRIGGGSKRQTFDF